MSQSRLSRLRLWIISLLIACDQFLRVLLGGPKYILFGGQRPDPDQTISGKVGSAAMAGKRWARLCEVIIDRLFIWLGAGRGHCRTVAAREAKRAGKC